MPQFVAKKHSIRVSVLLVSTLLTATLLAYNRQGMVDAWRLQNYQASGSVAGLANATTMTTKARNIFYVNAPIITAQKQFSSNCPSNTEKTVVLGCYHGNQQGIYVLAVSDDRLNGVEQVTAAHEMLHAAYDRLSSRQKKSVDTMLNRYYANDLDDDVIKQQIVSYKQSEPKDVSNEMHSLFATEVTKLPTELEQYYGQYFTDRTKVVKLYNQYEAEFTNRQNTIKADDAQLKLMKGQIAASEQLLDGQLTNLNTERATLTGLRASGQITAYNAQVAGYNSAVNTYNRDANSLRALITSYNDLVQSRNAIAAETNQLTAEISNQVPTATQ